MKTSLLEGHDERRAHGVRGSCLPELPLLRQLLYPPNEDTWLRAWQSMGSHPCIKQLVCSSPCESLCISHISPVFVSPTGLILLFYLVFYGFLAALFTFTMWAMLQTLNDEIPKYRDQITSPGNGVDIIIAFKHHSIWLNLSSGL